MIRFFDSMNIILKCGLNIKRKLAMVLSLPGKISTRKLIAHGLPIRLDVINAKCVADNRKTRCIFSSRNPLKIFSPIKRVKEVRELVQEQPFSEDLLYILTHEGGNQSITREPFREHFSRTVNFDKSRRNFKRCVTISGVKDDHVISAFAGDEDVTEFAVCIESCSKFKDMTFEDWYQYLRYKGVKRKYQEIAILLTDLTVTKIRQETNSVWEEI
jgi:hypothetical protein